jgi:hypothetical protein
VKKFMDAIEAVAKGAQRLKDVISGEETSSYQSEELGPVKITNAAYCLRVAHQLYMQTVAAEAQAEHMSKAEEMMEVAIKARQEMGRPSPVGQYFSGPPVEVLTKLVSHLSPDDRAQLLEALQNAPNLAHPTDGEEDTDPRVAQAEQTEAAVRAATGQPE